MTSETSWQYSQFLDSLLSKPKNKLMLWKEKRSQSEIKKKTIVKQNSPVKIDLRDFECDVMQGISTGQTNSQEPFLVWRE